MPIIYLAPANHYNAYCVAGYDEKTQCEKLSTLIAAKLAEYTGVTVKYTTVFAEAATIRGARKRRQRWALIILYRRP